MSKKICLIAEKRERLLAQIAMQRLMLSQNMQTLHTPLVIADRGIAVFRFIKSHPVWLVGAGAAIIAMRPVGIVKWVQRGIVAWGVIRRLRNK